MNTVFTIIAAHPLPGISFSFVIFVVEVVQRLRMRWASLMCLDERGGSLCSENKFVAGIRGMIIA
jgi:hypothetical protein